MLKWFRKKDKNPVDAAAEQAAETEVNQAPNIAEEFARGG